MHFTQRLGLLEASIMGEPYAFHDLMHLVMEKLCFRILNVHQCAL